MNDNKELSTVNLESSLESSSGLKTKAELCLSAYLDGECGFLKRFWAKRTLQRSFEARRFVDELERTSSEFKDAYIPELQVSSQDLSLWPRIAARIQQEERLSLLRSIPTESLSPFSWGSKLGWSGFGAVAASLMFLVYLPYTVEAPVSTFRAFQFAGSGQKVQSAARSTQLASQSFGTPHFLDSSMENSAMISSHLVSAAPLQQTESGISAKEFESASIRELELRALQLASLESSARQGSDARIAANSWRFLQEEPRFIDSTSPQLFAAQEKQKTMAPQVFEADWMRSNGRVNVLKDPSGNTAILWVKRTKALPRRETISPRNSIALGAGNR